MLKIHTSDGQTIKVDLTDEIQARSWLNILSRDDFQATIKGVSLVEKHLIGKCRCCGSPTDRSIGVQYSISRPEDFKKVFFHLESIAPNGRIKGGEKVIVFTDDVMLMLMAHRSQPAARVTISKVGKQMYNPYKERKDV